MKLDEKKSQQVKSHISMCANCAKLHSDFASVLNLCEEDFNEAAAPPNSQALWCRINNIIETEIRPEIEAEQLKVETKVSIWSSIWNSSLRFSPSQIAAAVLGIAIISSLLTVVGIKSFIPSDDEIR